MTEKEEIITREEIEDFQRVNALKRQIKEDLTDIHKTLKECSVTSRSDRNTMVKEFKESIVLQSVLEYIEGVTFFET